jgi:PASTA domain
MTGQSLVANILIARSQGAKSVTPALVGSVMRFPIPSLIFTILLAKREAESQQSPPTGVALTKIPVPDFTLDHALATGGQPFTVTEATKQLYDLGLAVTLSLKDSTVADEGIVLDQSIKGKQVPLGTSVNLEVSLGPGPASPPFSP